MSHRNKNINKNTKTVTAGDKKIKKYFSNCFASFTVTVLTKYTGCFAAIYHTMFVKLFKIFEKKEREFVLYQKKDI